MDPGEGTSFGGTVEVPPLLSHLSHDVVDGSESAPLVNNVTRSYSKVTRSGPAKHTQPAVRSSRENTRDNRKFQPPPKTGRKEGTALKVVTHVKRIKIFVSRLSPECTVDNIKNFVDTMIDDVCEVEKLHTKFPTYSSFVVICAKVHEEKIMNEEEWETGVMIRPFMGSLRKTGKNGVRQ